jgi:hypothetical protein
MERPISRTAASAPSAMRENAVIIVSQCNNPGERS